MTDGILSEVLDDMPPDAVARLRAEADGLDRPLEAWLHGQPSPSVALGAFANRLLTAAGRTLARLDDADPLVRASARLRARYPDTGRQPRGGGDTLVVTTDLLDAHNDMVQVHIDAGDHGALTLHDDGETLGDLELCGAPCGPGTAARRYAARAAAAHGCEIDDDDRLHRSMGRAHAESGRALAIAVAGLAQACATTSALLLMRESGHETAGVDDGDREGTYVRGGVRRDRPTPRVATRLGAAVAELATELAAELAADDEADGWRTRLGTADDDGDPIELRRRGDQLELRHGARTIDEYDDADDERTVAAAILRGLCACGTITDRFARGLRNFGLDPERVAESATRRDVDDAITEWTRQHGLSEAEGRATRARVQDALTSTDAGDPAG